MINIELCPTALPWSVIPTRTGLNISEINTELDQMQAAYKAAVEQSIDSIKQEEALA